MRDQNMLSVIDLLSYTDTSIFNVSVLNAYVYSFILSESFEDVRIIIFMYMFILFIYFLS
nr:MAG TPA: hypothetical protein [Bacteriophage sp.]